jgi:hypothetical protein
MTAGSRRQNESRVKVNDGLAHKTEKARPEKQKATACRGFHDSNCLRPGVARIRDEASGVPKGAASGDVGVRIGCGSCAKEYDKESAGVNHEFAPQRMEVDFCVSVLLLTRCLRTAPSHPDEASHSN